MKSETKRQKFKIKEIQDKYVILQEIENEVKIIQVPKYKMPLEIQKNQIITISEFGMYEIEK